MAKDKKKDHAHTKAKKEPGKRKAIAAAAAAVVAAAAGGPVDAPDPAGSEPPAATAHRRPAQVAAPDPAGGDPRPAKARRRPAQVAAPDRTGDEHHAARAHGRATQVDTSLPGTRPELMALHAAARARRNAAALDSPAFRAAITDLERIEIRIAAVDRAADPPLG